jgi:hypothetical protein
MAVVVAGCSGDGGQPPAATRVASSKPPTIELLPPPRIQVYVRENGWVYHHWDGKNECRFLYEKRVFRGIPIDLEDAEAEGYEPCAICNPK